MTQRIGRWFSGLQVRCYLLHSRRDNEKEELVNAMLKGGAILTAGIIYQLACLGERAIWKKFYSRYIGKCCSAISYF